MLNRAGLNFRGRSLGVNLDLVRAVKVGGDSIRASVNESDLAFVDTGCQRFESDGIYVIMFNDATFIEPLSAAVAKRKNRVRSNNDKCDPQRAAENQSPVSGRVQALLTLQAH